LIETPGRTGDFKARMIAFIIFGKSVQYMTKGSFYLDAHRHGVYPDNKQFQWDPKKGKYGWPVLWTSRFNRDLPAPKRGIVYAKDVDVPDDIDRINGDRDATMLSEMLQACQKERNKVFAIIGADHRKRMSLLERIKDKARSEAMLVTPEDTQVWRIGNNIVRAYTWQSVLEHGIDIDINRIFSDYECGDINI